MENQLHMRELFFDQALLFPPLRDIKPLQNLEIKYMCTKPSQTYYKLII